MRLYIFFKTIISRKYDVTIEKTFARKALTRESVLLNRARYFGNATKAWLVASFRGISYQTLCFVPYLLSTLTFICVFNTGTMKDVRGTKAEARLNRHLARVIVLKAKSRSHDTFSFYWNSRGPMYNFLCFLGQTKNLNLCISEYVYRKQIITPS